MKQALPWLEGKTKMNLRFIICGGGTGGHVFPALAIAREIKTQKPQAQILFVGAKGKLEMQKVPKAGFPIKGLWISGLQRSWTIKNLLFPLKLIHSLWKSVFILKEYKPDAVIGVGGYASGPVLFVASKMGIPTLIQEQNSYAGLTNKWLGKRASVICVAYPGMERFFHAGKIVLTGNPVRKDLISTDRREAAAFFGIDPGKKTILVFGGSLGARTLNEAVADKLELLQTERDVQLLWQWGSLYESKYRPLLRGGPPNVVGMSFIDRMDLAYGAADLVICRAGALTISELSALGKAAILVPSPNVAEDHQTKNASALLRAGAIEMVADREAKKAVLPKGLKLVRDEQRLKKLREEMIKWSRPNATKEIVKQIFNLIDKK